MLSDKHAMEVMVQMTKIFWKLNDEERMALMDYHKIIEDNARWEMLVRLFSKLILVMHEEEFRQFEKELRKEYDGKNVQFKNKIKK